MPTESFFTQSSLAYIASAGAGKDGKAYSIKPADGTGDFTFSRGSNLAATRVGADGLIEKGRENLVTYSNTFSSWTSINSTLTSNQAGYDGTNDAWLIEKTADAGRIQNNVAAGLATYSVYAKAGSASWLRLLKGANASAYFDLSNSTIGNLSLTIDATITSVGNGWYRCTITYQDQYAGSVRIYPALANNDTTGTSGNILIQDAQVEVGLAATEYIESGATKGTAGILEDTPRFDYSNGASCPSLLLEPSRTNLISQSEYFGSYINYGSADTANSTISVEGVNNATLIVGNGTQNQVYTASPDISVTSAGLYTLSIFAKKGTNNYFRLYLDGFAGSSNNGAYFDLLNGSTPTSGASIKDYGNGWYKCSITATIVSGDLVGKLAFNVTPNTNSVFFSSASEANGKNIYIYGATLEAGSYPTSYIPTYGSGVSRAGESMSKDGLADYIGQSTGTFYIEFELPDPNTNSNAMWTSVEQGSNQGTNRALLYTSANSDVLKIDIRANGSSVGISGAAITNLFADTNYKVAVRYESGNVAVYVNGVSEYTSTSTWTYSSDLTKFNFNNQSQAFQGKLKQAMLFTSSLSDAECIALTTI